MFGLRKVKMTFLCCEVLETLIESLHSSKIKLINIEEILTFIVAMLTLRSPTQGDKLAVV